MKLLDALLVSFDRFWNEDSETCEPCLQELHPDQEQAFIETERERRAYELTLENAETIVIATHQNTNQF